MSGCREPLACILSHELTLYYNPHATARFTDIATQQCHTCFCALHNEIMLKRLVPPSLVSTGNRKVPYVTARLFFFYQCKTIFITLVAAYSTFAISNTINGPVFIPICEFLLFSPRPHTLIKFPFYRLYAKTYE